VPGGASQSYDGEAMEPVELKIELERPPTEADLLWRLQPRRGNPLIYLGGRIYLTGLSQERFSFLPRRLGLRFSSESVGFLCQPVGTGQRVPEMASLHGAALVRGGRERDWSLGHR
jgi:hypothetical protein